MNIYELGWLVALIGWGIILAAVLTGIAIGMSLLHWFRRRYIENDWRDYD